MYRVMVKLGGRVGELGLSKRDLADLCDIRPGTAGEWVSGVVERISLVDLARICEELELEITDVLELQKDGEQKPREGRRDRIMHKVAPLRQVRRRADAERRKFKAEEQRRMIEAEILQRQRRRHSRA